MFLNELDASLANASSKENDLLKILKLDSIEELGALRKMAKAMMGHIKAKISSGSVATSGVAHARPRPTDDFERDCFVEMH